jgi:hypothetical protein
MTQLATGAGLIFMKIGVHAQEPLEQIIARKRKELGDAGKIFWGYGGNTCHPLSFVRPFATEHAAAGKPIILVMHKMESHHFAEPELAKSYSDDGVDWHPIPKGIHVRGSRYAMVLGSLEEEEFDLDIERIRVARGMSRGLTGADYLRGHVDKGCFEVIEPITNQAVSDHRIRIGLTGILVPPYAVLLR